jgi:nucleoside-diphosphate-sugar epimerase
MKKNYLITGGAGYVGSVLTNRLASLGHNVAVLDTMWFGNNLKKNSKIEIIKKDIRDIKNISLKNIDAVIHLANIANDPSVEINPNLSWEINVMAGYQLLEKAKNQGVKKFIFASSGSVYGIKKEKKVTENLSLVPLSTYNKTKMIFERVMFSNSSKMKLYCLRPGTICGISPRMRWDLSVNILTLSALKNRNIRVFGGNQSRSNIHIQDMIRVYQFFLDKELPEGIYNAAFEVYKIKEVAKLIQKKTKAKIEYLNSNDRRSYSQNSEKLLNLGFKPNYSVNDAISEIIELYNQGLIKDSINGYNLEKMKKLKIN